MSEAAATLTNLWVGDSNITTTTPVKVSGGNDDIMSFYAESGLDSMVRETGVLSPNKSFVTVKEQQSPSTQVTKVFPAMLHVVPSPKGKQQILPRLQLTSSTAPVQILTTQQRQPSATTILQAFPTVTTGTQHILSQSVNTPQSTSSDWGSATKRRGEPTELDFGTGSTGKRKRREKEGKGLRHFSMKVCEKVQAKQVTSYNEVADELVREFTAPSHQASPISPSEQSQYDQKNIRRRVYDALNVLMAMNIISKEKKEIRWIGLPTNSRQECDKLEREKKLRLERIKQKRSQLHELILQQIAFKNLVARNKALEADGSGAPTSNSAIHLPYIIVNTSKKTVIDCSISNDKFEYLFNFDNTFEIHDDIEVLKRMGMAFSLEKGQCDPADVEKAKKMVPKALEMYIDEMAIKNKEAFSSSIVAGPSGVHTQGTSKSAYQPGDPQLSPLAFPLSQTDQEVARATAESEFVASQDSSLGSFSDAGQSRGATDTPSSLMESESDEESLPFTMDHNS